MANFIKPTIQLPVFPLINMWFQAEYDAIETHSELIEFVHSKLNEIETTQNEVRKQSLIAIAYPLYSILTNKSYQSKISI